MTKTDVTNGSVKSPGEVLALLRDQACLYERLESFASRQRTLVSNADTGPLLAVLADRQKLAAELMTIGRTLAPVRQSWDAYRDRLTSEQRAEADRLIAATSERLRRLIQNDEQDARILSARKQVVSGALRATHETGQALSAYRTTSQGAARADRLNEAS